jgi:hypothetical protein
MLLTLNLVSERFHGSGSEMFITINSIF